jgi:proline racemase
MTPVSTTDYHTAGEPFRIVTGGVPAIPGRDALEKRRWAMEHLDEVRRLLVMEPRGHADMYGGFPFPPEDGGADLGVLFFHNDGFSTACGHGTIALVAWGLERGPLAGRADGEHEVTVDVPSGRLRTWATLRDGDVDEVRFRNVPSFVLQPGVTVAGVTADIAYGGAFYAVADAPAGVSVPELPRLIALGRAVKDELNRRGGIVHPLEPRLRDIYGVIWVEGDRNVTVFANGEVDRSPCGSCTSARVALRHHRGQMRPGDAWTARSIIDTEFRATLVEETEVAGRPAVVPEVAGSAHMTGRHEFVLEPADPLGTGFLLR